jgi:competence protein ComGC
MTSADEDPTPTPAAATPLDYAAPTPWQLSPAGSRLIEAGIVVAIILLLVAVLMPSLGSNRAAAERVACMANLRSVGQSLQTYAHANGGRFPDTLGQVILAGYVPDVRIFLCYSGADTPARGTTPPALAADLASGGHLSYAYVGRGLTSAADPYTVIAFEHAGHHKGGGGVLLCADGHAEWLLEKDMRAVTDWHAAGKGPVVLANPAGGSPLATRPAPRDRP